jgi:hypothetical protein
MVGEFREVALHIVEQFVKKVGTKIFGNPTGPVDYLEINSKAAALEFVMDAVRKGVPPDEIAGLS